MQDYSTAGSHVKHVFSPCPNLPAKPTLARQPNVIFILFFLLLKVPCVLRYWDNAQKCYISYKDFFISESSPTAISLPDPCIADPSEIIVASEWQIVVDVIGNIDYPEEFR